MYLGLIPCHAYTLKWPRDTSTPTHGIHVFTSASKHLLVTEPEYKATTSSGDSRLLLACHQSSDIKDSLSVLICWSTSYSFTVLKSDKNVFTVAVLLTVTCRSWTPSVRLMISFNRSSQVFQFWLLAVVWTSMSLHLRLINSSTVYLVYVWVWQIMRVILQSGYVALCICVWLFVLFQSDLSLLLVSQHSSLWQPTPSVSYMYTHTEKHLGQGHRSVGLNGRWSAVTNRQWGCLMMWGGTQWCCTCQLQMADMFHSPFHLLSLLLHEILPNNYTPQLRLWLTNTTAEVSASMNLWEPIQIQNSTEVSDKCSSCRSGCGAALMLETDRQSFVPFSQLVSIFNTAETTVSENFNFFFLTR